MSKSTIFMLFIAALAAAAMLGLFALEEGPSPSTSPQPAPAANTATLGNESASARIAASSLRSLRENDASSRGVILGQMTERSAIRRWLDPSLAVQLRFPTPRPDRPPQPFPRLSRPDEKSLIKGAQSDIQAFAKKNGLQWVGLYRQHNKALTEIHTTLPKGAPQLAVTLKAWVTSSPKREVTFGVLHEGDMTFDVVASPIQSGADQLWAVSVQPLDGETLKKYQSALGGGLGIAVFEDGALLHATADSPQSLTAWASKTPSQLAGDPIKAEALGALNLAPQTLASFSGTQKFLLALTTKGSGRLEAPQAKDVSKATPQVSQGLFTRLKASPTFSKPKEHIKELILAFAGALILTLLGRLLMVAESRKRWRTLKQQIEGADSLESVSMFAFEQALAQAIIAQAPVKIPPARSKPSIPKISSPRLKAEKQKLSDNLGNSKQQVRQLEKQLEFARRKIATSDSERVTNLEQKAHWKEQAESLQKQLTEKDRQLQNAQQPLSRVSQDRSTVEAQQVTVIRERGSSEGLGMDDLLQDIDSSLSGSLTAMAQQIGSMSPSQLARLPKAPRLERRVKNPSKITSMGMSSALDSSMGFPTPHRPINEAEVRQKMQHPEEEDEAPTERFDRFKLGFAQKLADSDVKGPPSATLSGGLFGRSTPPERASRVSRRSLPAAPQSLSPAGLLEALKRRGQQESSPIAHDPDPKTRITPVARELLEQSKSIEIPKTLSQSGVFGRTGSKLIGPTNDSEYFKRLYEDFLNTKIKCGENTDNLTLERFVNRLARNKQALMERYNCGTVRFKVYTKDGRAALKATPVK